MEMEIPKEKGPTIMLICMLKTELPNWADLTVKQTIDNLTISDEQQDRDIDAAEVRCDQTDGRRSER
eukprot:15906351-Heterocapsa_arctica.AAC.1